MNMDFRYLQLVTNIAILEPKGNKWIKVHILKTKLYYIKKIIIIISRLVASLQSLKFRFLRRNVKYH